MGIYDIWDLIYYNLIGVLLVLARVTGIFTFNPIFSRSNIPTRVKVGASLALTVMMVWNMGGTVGYIPANLLDFVFCLLKEGVVGYIFGFITNLILTVIQYAGDLIDTQVGSSMAKAMDPSTGNTVSLTGTFFQYLFILYFFIIGGHLSYIKLFHYSYEILPIGFDFNLMAIDLTYTITCYLGTVITLAVKFALPIIISQLITEFSVGVMMKAVPTIQVFVINIQLKIVVGFLVLLAAAGPMSGFLQELLDILFENLYKSASLIGS